QGAFLHHPGILVIFARAIGAGPRAQLAADAGVGIDQHDAVALARVGCARRAHGDAGRVVAMQAALGEMDSARSAGLGHHLEGVNPVEPHARRLGAIGIGIGQRRRMAGGVPFLAVHRAGVTADADIEVDDQAELLLRRRGRQAGHGSPSGWSATRLPCPGRTPLPTAACASRLPTHSIWLPPVSPDDTLVNSLPKRSTGCCPSSALATSPNWGTVSPNSWSAQRS